MHYRMGLFHLLDISDIFCCRIVEPFHIFNQFVSELYLHFFKASKCGLYEKDLIMRIKKDNQFYFD